MSVYTLFVHMSRPPAHKRHNILTIVNILSVSWTMALPIQYGESLLGVLDHGLRIILVGPLPLLWAQFDFRRPPDLASPTMEF